MHDGRKGLAAAEPEPDLDDEDPELTAELGRRLDALLRGEARTLSRAEMEERLARRRAARPSR
jgi:hypothetical protein